MKTISSIEKIGKGERYKVFADGELFGIFEAEILAKLQLKSGSQYDEEFLQSLFMENADYACFNRGLTLLEKSMKSEKMLKTYLKEKGYPRESIDRACQKLIEYGYIDDEEFCRNFISIYQDSRSRRKLKYDLLGKGINEELIDKVLDEALEDNEDEKCLKFAEKFMKNREFDLNNRKKLYNHLAGKGFDYDVISRIWGILTGDRD